MARGAVGISNLNRRSGDLITPDIYNEDHNRFIVNFYPEKIDDLSETPAMFAKSDFNPYLNGAIQRPNSLAQELEALRHQVKSITGNRHWYLPPANSMTDITGMIPTVVPPPENFVSTSAPDSSDGITGSLWVRLNGSTLEVYKRTSSGWPTTPQAQLTDTSTTGVTFTGSSNQPTGGSDGDIHLQLAGDAVRLWRRTGGTWATTLTYDGVAVTAGTAAPSGGDQGDVYFQFSSTAISVFKRGATDWGAAQATVTVNTEEVTVPKEIGAALPDNATGANGDEYIRAAAGRFDLYTKADDLWSITHSVIARDIKDYTIGTPDPQNDYLPFMDAGTNLQPNRRATIRTILRAAGTDLGFLTQSEINDRIDTRVATFGYQDQAAVDSRISVETTRLGFLNQASVDTRINSQVPGIVRGRISAELPTVTNNEIDSDSGQSRRAWSVSSVLRASRRAMPNMQHHQLTGLSSTDFGRLYQFRSSLSTTDLQNLINKMVLVYGILDITLVSSTINTRFPVGSRVYLYFQGDLNNQDSGIGKKSGYVLDIYGARLSPPNNNLRAAPGTVADYTITDRNYAVLYTFVRLENAVVSSTSYPHFLLIPGRW